MTVLQVVEYPEEGVALIQDEQGWYAVQKQSGEIMELDSNLHKLDVQNSDLKN